MVQHSGIYIFIIPFYNIWIMSYHGALRAARDQLIPEMAELGPRLVVEQTVVLDALTKHLRDQGVNPEYIPEEDRNKTERHIVAGYFVHQLRELLVSCPDGAKPEEATFHRSLLAVVTHRQKREGALLAGDLRKTFQNGAEAIEAAYTDGPRGNWWPTAADRYAILGARAVELAVPFATPSPHTGRTSSAIPLEGTDLREALRNEVLADALPDLFDYVKRHVADTSERPKAAHDLSYLVTMLAGLHLQEFVNSGGIFKLMGIPVEKDKDGKYRAAMGRMHDVVRLAYARIDPSRRANVTLKCPAHTHVGSGPTDLEYFTHAAINAAYENYNV